MGWDDRPHLANLTISRQILYVESILPSFATRFGAYFKREIAEKAANPLAEGVEIELHVQSSDGSPVETFTFTRLEGKNHVKPESALAPQIIFKMTPLAAEEILADASEEIGKIGIHIGRLLVSPDASKRMSFQIKAGFLTLFSKGFFGVFTAGGAEFAAFLASRGLNGIGAIKTLLSKGRK